MDQRYLVKSKLTSFNVLKTRNKDFSLKKPRYYMILFLTLEMEKTLRLIFVTFSELEKSVTKMRNVTKVSVTKMSGDSIYNNFEVLTRGFN